MSLSTEPNVNVLSPDRLRLLLHSPPGGGKTTFASKWHPQTNYIIDLEGGTRFLEHAWFGKRVKSFSEFLQVVEDLVAGGHPYRTVTIDTLDALGRMADQEAGQRHGKITAQLVDWGKGTADRDATIFRAIQKLVDSDLGLILLSHSTRVEDGGSEKWYPSVDEKRQRPYYMGIVDFMWFVRRNGPTPELVTEPNAKAEVKSRLALPSPMPLNAANAYKALADACVQTTKKES